MTTQRQISAPIPNSFLELARGKGCDLDGDEPNAYTCDNCPPCISDKSCYEKDDHQIFNHFYFDADEKLQLIPECRNMDDDDFIAGGFTCGNDSRLRNGVKVFIPNIEPTFVQYDTRKIKLLKTSEYESLSRAITCQLKYESQPITPNITCDVINHFSDGCESSFLNDKGFTQFEDVFDLDHPDCAPQRIANIDDEHKGWFEEYKIFIGYDDLLFQPVINDHEIVLDVHKVSKVMIIRNSGPTIHSMYT